MPLKYSFTLLNADYVELDTSWNYKNVISPFYRLYLIDKGHAELSTPVQSLDLEPGYLYLVPSFTLFNQWCDGELGQYYIHITEESADGQSLFAGNRKLFRMPASETDRQCLQRIIKLNPGRDLGKTDDPKMYEKVPVIREFLDRNNQSPIAKLLETQGLILQLLSRFMEPDSFIPFAPKSISPKVPEAVNFIGTNLQEKLTVDMLAHRANLSIDYFSKLFYRETGERPLAYIQRKRIERSQFLLVTTNMPQAVVAAETGFDDISYFARLFRKITGHTPGSYKKMHLL